MRQDARAARLSAWFSQVVSNPSPKTYEIHLRTVSAALFSAALPAFTLLPRALRAAAAEAKLPPIRALTRGPKFHWRGYYDKLLFDPGQRFVLANEVDFEGRSPRPDDVLRVGMIDTQDGDRWIELGTSRVWNWQQGCMLQWVPGTESYQGEWRCDTHPCASPDGKKVLIDSQHGGNGRQVYLIDISGITGR